MDILLVDDNLLMQQVISRFLTGLGHTVSCAEAASDAHALATDRPFELLMIDLRLPDADGAEALEQLRTLPGYGATPAIAISGYGEEYARQARAAGFDLFLSKPIEFDALQGAIEAFSGREHTFGR
jgi:two-component system CheB/CheR fusion protein